MHAGSSSLTRDRTLAPCIGSADAYPLDHQGSPPQEYFFITDWNDNILAKFGWIKYIKVNSTWVLVYSGCYKNGWLIDNRNFFPIFLGVVSLRSQCQHGQVRALFQFIDFFFFFFFFKNNLKKTFLAAPCSMWDLSSQSGIEPMPPALEAQTLTHWTAREVSLFSFF